MFGTLSIQSKEPVTFVENSDLASVLSRNRQERPHVSCHLCRARKVWICRDCINAHSGNDYPSNCQQTRCSGEPTGCDKCVAIGAECQYPSRPSRRKKRSRSAFQSSQQDVTIVDGANQEPMNRDTYSNPNISSINATAATDMIDGVVHDHQAPSGTTAEDSMLSATSLFDFDDEVDGDAQHLEHWLSSGTNAEAEARAPSTSARSAMLDAWPDLGALSSGGFGETSRHWDPLTDDQLPLGNYQRQLSEPEEDTNEAAGGVPNDVPSLAMESVLASLSAALASPRHRPSGGSSSRSESLDQHRSGLENPNSSSAYRPLRDSRKNPWPPSSSSSSLSRANSNGHGSMPVSASDIQRRSIAQNLSNTNRHRPSGPQSSVSASASSSVSAAGGAAGSVGRAASSTVPSQQRENCRCAKYSAALLELLEELGANMGLTRNPASMGVLLGLLRSALARCKEALELEPCRACKGSSQTERLILLTLLLQFMSNMYERVVESCVKMIDDMVNENHEDAVPQYLVGSTPSPRSTSNQALGGGTQDGWANDGPQEGQRRDAVQGLARAPGDAMEDLWFSTYHIQSSCERLHVLTTLVTVQITELSYLLGNPKLRAGGRQNQLAILASIEKVTNSSRRMLRMSIDRAIASKEQH
ncbi:unnamed protein product [Clonostachys solani]|uniref:Zn(2)-C6 fungal-type domain-containing protein n=1 Tax=Clonostachys solani TaxID=160281 RepID=A0A9P0EK26_9HYPO|nr:unnamed protein product [Clonostachys solani]